jgi:alpha-L-rhamnosidase
MVQLGPCDKPLCPGDKQTAYRIEMAASVDDLDLGDVIWDSGKVSGSQQLVYFSPKDVTLESRDTIVWRVRVWDAHGQPSRWSKPSQWTMGLLANSDWGDARWINHPKRALSDPLPLFARQFDVKKKVRQAHLYLAGIGLHHVTLNGQDVTDEVLAPGYSNWQLSSEYRTYGIEEALIPGTNSLAVSLGHGPAYVNRSILNSDVGRTSPYAWWQSSPTGNTALTSDVSSGATAVRLRNTSSFYVGGTINIDTGDGGENLESRRITGISQSSIQFEPALELSHSSGALVTGSGNNIAATEPAAGAAVAPRLIARLELVYDDGSTDTIVSDRAWKTTLGPLVTDAWYSGSDYDARREISDWNSPDLSSDSWISAGISPPPNLATRLVSRTAEPVKIQERFTPISITNPASGTWVFNLGQNIAGWPLLTIPEMDAGITIKILPAESLNKNGTVNQESIGVGGRGRDVFNTYTTAGRPGGESWHPRFQYFAMQFVQVTGLPKDFTPTKELITGLRIQADVPSVSNFTSSNARINRLHKMSRYSVASNMMSVFTDCPGREKLSYPADFTQPIGAIYRNFGLYAYLHTTQRHLVEGQSIADTSMRGNVPLKVPVYDWGYTGRFGDEINWGNAIVLVPSLLHDLYGDVSVMTATYDEMVKFVNYIEREKAENFMVDAALADWVDAGGVTSGLVTGTWGYFVTIQAMTRIANLTNHSDDAEAYAALSENIRLAFNNAFWDPDRLLYTSTGKNGNGNATQAHQALALDAGLVPDEHREQVLAALVELAETHPSADGQGPHLSGGTIGLGPIVRALSAGGRDDVLWKALQQNDEPSYGYFLEATDANPNGFTTIGERWTRGSSKNHMILAQIEEWFHAAIAGISPFRLTTLSTSWENQLVFHPKPVGDLTSAEGTYQMPAGEARSQWTLSDGGAFRLRVTVPPNTEAEVRVPGTKVQAAKRAKEISSDSGDKFSAFKVPPGTHDFTSELSDT